MHQFQNCFRSRCAFLEWIPRLFPLAACNAIRFIGNFSFNYDAVHNIICHFQQIAVVDVSQTTMPSLWCVVIVVRCCQKTTHLVNIQFVQVVHQLYTNALVVVVNFASIGIKNHRCALTLQQKVNSSSNAAHTTRSES